MSFSDPFARRFFLLGIVLALAVPALTMTQRGTAAETAASSAGSEQTIALGVLDAVIARFDALLAQDDDLRHRAATTAKLDAFKQRREALRKEFDQTRYDELRIDLNLEFQRLASWMAPPKSPPPGKAK